MKKIVLSGLLLSLVLNAPAFAEEKKKAASVKVAPITIDTDKDGSISLAEAKALAEKQFGMYDPKKTGSFDMKAYRVPFDALAKAKKLDPKNKANDEKAITESFARMDSDKDSKISKAEFLKDAELRHKTMDGNSDGKVSKEEMLALEKRIKEAHQKAKK